MSNTRRLRRSVARGAVATQLAEAADDNRLNAYLCQVCERHTVTIDLHQGVTPMFLACRAAQPDGAPACQGRATSLMYPDLPWNWDGAPRPTPMWEWYMPFAAEAEKLRRSNSEVWDHVRRGGLLLRERA